MDFTKGFVTISLCASSILLSCPEWGNAINAVNGEEDSPGEMAFSVCKEDSPGDMGYVHSLCRAGYFTERADRCSGSGVF